MTKPNLFFALDVQGFVASMDTRARSILFDALLRSVKDELDAMPDASSAILDDNIRELAESDLREDEQKLFFQTCEQYKVTHEAARRYCRRLQYAVDDLQQDED